MINDKHSHKDGWKRLPGVQDKPLPAGHFLDISTNTSAQLEGPEMQQILQTMDVHVPHPEKTDQGYLPPQNQQPRRQQQDQIKHGNVTEHPENLNKASKSRKLAAPV